MWEGTGPDTAQRRGRGTDETLDAIAAAGAASPASGSASPRTAPAPSRRCGCCATFERPRPAAAESCNSQPYCRHRVAPCDRNCPLDTGRTRC
jgi:hypothetical protein